MAGNRADHRDITSSKWRGEESNNKAKDSDGEGSDSKDRRNRTGIKARGAGNTDIEWKKIS